MDYAARITGTGSSFPKNCVTNDDVVQKLAESGIETNSQWIWERTGIRQRRHSEVGNSAEHNSSLGLAAAKKALKMAGKTAKEIDQIIYATCTPDTILPSTACWLQHKIGAARAWVMDINAACSGFVYGVTTAEQFIRTGYVKTALVIGAEVLSSLINWRDRGMCILFGDGAGAAVVEQVEAGSTHRILSSRMLSDGNLWELLHVPAAMVSRDGSVEVAPEPLDLVLVGTIGREEMEHNSAVGLFHILACPLAGVNDVVVQDEVNAALFRIGALEFVQ